MSDENEAADAVESLLARLTPADLKAFHPQYRQAYRLYREQNLMLDTLIHKFQNPYLPLDIQMARQLAKKNPKAFEAALRNPDTQILVQQMETWATAQTAVRRLHIQEEFRTNPNAPIPTVFDEAKDLDLNGADVRNQLYDQRPNGMSAAQYNVQYGAAIWKLVLDDKGNVRKDSVGAEEQYAHAQAKLGALKDEIEQAEQNRRQFGPALKRLTPVARRLNEYIQAREDRNLRRVPIPPASLRWPLLPGC